LSLKCKKILICRRPSQSEELLEALKARKAEGIIFPTFDVEPMELDLEKKQTFRKLTDFDWIILSSVNGVDYFFKNLQEMGVSKELINSFCFAVVGDKTARSIKDCIEKPNIKLRADNLNDLLKKIARERNQDLIRAIHFTSQESLKNISVHLPQNILLQRIPIYRTILFRHHTPEEIQFARSGQYDVIFFGSPSSFDYFIELVGTEPLTPKMGICVPGKTTKAFIEEKGFRVSIVPEQPKTGRIIEALEKYFNEKSKFVYKNKPL